MRERERLHTPCCRSAPCSHTAIFFPVVLCCCMQGSLRDALDCGMLTKPGSFLAPSAVLTLAHDVAAAMMHLHRCAVVLAHPAALPALDPQLVAFLFQLPNSLY